MQQKAETVLVVILLLLLRLVAVLASVIIPIMRLVASIVVNVMTDTFVGHSCLGQVLYAIVVWRLLSVYIYRYRNKTISVWRVSPKASSKMRWMFS